MKLTSRSAVSPICRRRSAFTLVELLIVLAIITLLAEILFPVISRARENARRSSCQSNLRQIGLATVLYTQDFDDHFPQPMYHDDNGLYGWKNSIDTYIKSDQVFQCKSEPTTDDPSNVTDYYFNANLGTTEPGAQSKGVHVAAVYDSTVTVMLGDGSHNTTYTVWMPGYDYQAWNTTFNIGGQSFYIRNDAESLPGTVPGNQRHFNGANYAFVDGHVKWMKPEYVYGATQWYGTQFPLIANQIPFFLGAPRNLGRYRATFLIQ